MPTYEYKCQDCENRTAMVRSIDEVENTYFCETCNSALIRVYSLSAVTFNGSGFYSKDK
jgi:putative FmdB family regulatory protein